MRTITLLAAAVLLLAGCATTPPPAPPPAPQTIELRIETDDATLLSAGLDCDASNPLGRWTFHAPGNVEVLPHRAPLKLRCRLPGGRGGRSVQLVTVDGEQADAARRGGTAGAVVGGAVGVTGGAAAIALGVPALAPLMILGGAFQGWQVGRVVGAIAAEGRDGAPRYRTPVALRLTPR